MISYVFYNAESNRLTIKKFGQFDAYGFAYVPREGYYWLTGHKLRRFSYIGKL
jgi:hypothetical protein